jgi:hypothetical protein
MGALTLGVPLHRDRASSAELVLHEPSEVPSPRRSGVQLGGGLALLLACTLAAGPVWAESEADQRLRDTFGPACRARVDLGGVELRDVVHDLRSGRGHVEIERLHVGLGEQGVEVELDGLSGSLRRSPARRPQAPRVGPPAAAAPAPAQPDSRAALADAITELVGHLDGIPLHVRARGALELELADQLALTARDPSFTIDAAGQLSARGRLIAGTRARTWLHGDLELSASADDPLHVSLAGGLVLDPDTIARRLALHGHASPDRLDLALDEPGGGRATLLATRGSSDRVELDAEQLPVALLDPLLELLERGSGTIEPGTARAPAVGEARLRGHVELERTRSDGHERVRVRFDAVELEGLVVEREALAPRPLAFGPLGIDGELSVTSGRAGQAQLLLGHRGVALQVDVDLDTERLDLALAMPETDCQALLDALPEGSAPVLAGSRLAGRMPAALALHLDFAALDQARATYLGAEADPRAFDREFEQGVFVAPGSLSLEFPYLEQCRVERLGPAVDMAGLAGAYRHEFVRADGRRARRVLASGDPGYVPIAQIPELERAFVILEDWRFWDHDGFDREQIEKAFWYDLMAGRTRRGASTISQQTARTLWLGLAPDDAGLRAAGRPSFDRSIARKLVEGLLTAELERSTDKRRILEVYLNVIELGPNVRGVAEAARYHFGKRPHELDLVEALHLASLAPAPVGYSRRFASGEIDEAWREHLRLQIRRMRVRGMISDELADRYLYPRLDLVAHPELLSGPAVAP